MSPRVHVLLLGWCIYLLLPESREHSFPVVWQLVTGNTQTDGWSTGGSEWLSQHGTSTLPTHLPPGLVPSRCVVPARNIGLAQKFISIRDSQTFWSTQWLIFIFSHGDLGAVCYRSTTCSVLSCPDPHAPKACNSGKNEVKQKDVPPRWRALLFSWSCDDGSVRAQSSLKLCRGCITSLDDHNHPFFFSFFFFFHIDIWTKTHSRDEQKPGHFLLVSG